MSTLPPYGASIQGTKLHPTNQPSGTAFGGGRTAKEIFDLPALDKVVGLTGSVNGPTYKYVVGRDDLRVIAMGTEVTTAIGLNTWAAFAGESDAAHIAGDVAMLEIEVNTVIGALRKHNLEVVAVLQHMLEEQPRIIFLHYYGRGPALTLAEGFHAALAQLGGQGEAGRPLKTYSRSSVKAWIHWVRLLNLCIFAFLSAFSSRGQNAGSLKLEQKIPLPGVTGRIDHFSADIGGKRLFVAALGNGSVEVLDVERGEHIAEIKGLKEPQGVLYDTERNRLYVATGGDGKVRIYDGKTLGLESTLDFGDDADNLRADARSGDIWVGFGSGGIGIIDPSGQKVGTISLGSHPESFQFDEAADRVYVNVPKQLGVAVIDWKKRAIIAKWASGLSFANYPMALDRVNRRLLVGCRLPARLVVIDTTSGHLIKALPTVGDADEVFYDEKRRCIYIVGGEGAIEVIRQQSPDVYEPAGRTVTVPGARTGYWWPSSDRLYVAAPANGRQTAAVLVYAVGGAVAPNDR